MDKNLPHSIVFLHPERLERFNAPRISEEDLCVICVMVACRVIVCGVFLSRETSVVICDFVIYVSDL